MKWPWSKPEQPSAPQEPYAPPMHEECGHPIYRHRSDGVCVDCRCTMPALSVDTERDK